MCVSVAGDGRKMPFSHSAKVAALASITGPNDELRPNVACWTLEQIHSQTSPSSVKGCSYV